MVCLSEEQHWKLLHHLPHSCPLESNSKYTHSNDEDRKVCVCVCVCVCVLCHFIMARCWRGSSAPFPPLSGANSSLWHLERLIISGSHMHARSRLIYSANITESHICAFSPQYSNLMKEELNVKCVY